MRVEEDGEDESVYSLGGIGTGKRYAVVKIFQRRVYVNIREYSEKGSKLITGRKGLNLTTDNWKKLYQVAPDIDRAVERLNKKL